MVVCVLGGGGEGGSNIFSYYTLSGVGGGHKFLFEKTGRARIVFANQEKMYPHPLVLNDPTLTNVASNQ